MFSCSLFSKIVREDTDTTTENNRFVKKCKNDDVFPVVVDTKLLLAVTHINHDYELNLD